MKIGEEETGEKETSVALGERRSEVKTVKTKEKGGSGRVKVREGCKEASVQWKRDEQSEQRVSALRDRPVCMRGTRPRKFAPNEYNNSADPKTATYKLSFQIAVLDNIYSAMPIARF